MMPASLCPHCALAAQAAAPVDDDDAPIHERTVAVVVLHRLRLGLPVTAEDAQCVRLSHVRRRYVSVSDVGLTRLKPYNWNLLESPYGKDQPVILCEGPKDADADLGFYTKGVLPRRGVGVAYGPSGEGKTFVALDLLLHIGRGVEWRGRRTARAAVLYLAPDGGSVVANRLEAYRRHHGVVAADLVMVSVPVDLLGKIAAGDLAKVEELIGHVEQTPRHTHRRGRGRYGVAGDARRG